MRNKELIRLNIETLNSLSNFPMLQKLTLIEEFMGFLTIRTNKSNQKVVLAIMMKGRDKIFSINSISQKLVMNSEEAALQNFVKDSKTLKLIFCTTKDL